MIIIPKFSSPGLMVGFGFLLQCFEFVLFLYVATVEHTHPSGGILLYLLFVCLFVLALLYPFIFLVLVLVFFVQHDMCRGFVTTGRLLMR